MDMAIPYEFQKQVKTLASYRGHGTELISVYVPPKYSISEVAAKLRSEAGQAANIKSESTRKAVTGALEKILHRLKVYKVPPKSGMAIFCGNISTDPSKVNLELFVIEPPEPITVQLYRCDSSFFLEPLESMGVSKDIYGLVVLDGKEATVATLRGTTITIHKRLNSTAHQKHRMGGQSARRFERLHDEAIDVYYKRIGEAMNASFVERGVKGVIVGGPGPAKEDFIKAKTFDYRLKVLGTIDTGYTEEQGLKELLAKSDEVIGEQAIAIQRRLIERFMKEVVTGGLATYGINEVIAALESGQADTLLVSEGLDWKRVKYRCSQCGLEIVKNVKEPKDEPHTCGGMLRPVEKADLIDWLIELAESKGIKIQTFSSETSEGAQFLAGFGGVGALLRYR